MKRFSAWGWLAASLILFSGTGRADHLFIPHTAFNGSNYDTTYLTYNHYTRMQSQGFLVAPVYLPQGAVVNGVILFFEDKGPGYIACNLVRVNPDAGTERFQFPIQSDGSTAGIRHEANWAVTQGTRTVNHAVFSYYVRIQFSFTDNFSNYALYGVRIHYH